VASEKNKKNKESKKTIKEINKLKNISFLENKGKVSVRKPRVVVQ